MRVNRDVRISKCSGVYHRLSKEVPYIFRRTAKYQLQLKSKSTSTTLPHSTTKMGVSFDYAPDRPEHIETILNGLDRYNPETTSVFQDYVMQQCENQTYDSYANLALLKLYALLPVP